MVLGARVVDGYKVPVYRLHHYGAAGARYALRYPPPPNRQPSLDLGPVLTVLRISAASVE